MQDLYIFTYVATYIIFSIVAPFCSVCRRVSRSLRWIQKSIDSSDPHRYVTATTQWGQLSLIENA